MEWTPEEIKKVVEAHPVVVFGKGEKNMPMCGFSNRAYKVLESCGQPFEVINIFKDESIRPALVAFSDFPTTPQIFIGGEFIGGSDIAMELHESGELQKKIDSALGSA